MKERISPILICNLICILLIAAVFILQLSPYWEFGNQDVSIGALVWFPIDHTDLQSHLELQMGKAFDINAFVNGPLLLEFLCFLSIGMFIWKPASLLSGCINLAFGIAGTVTYLTNSALCFGFNWWLHLGLCFCIWTFGILSVNAAITTPKD